MDVILEKGIQKFGPEREQEFLQELMRQIDRERAFSPFEHYRKDTTSFPPVESITALFLSILALVIQSTVINWVFFLPILLLSAEGLSHKQFFSRLLGTLSLFLFFLVAINCGWEIPYL
ncbi:MAG TPA: hypothetical protein P5560_06790 [Thermotogota bacterium]|nr:hypothetical protein [Thermotogota bacterium]HRW92637.1 hypothetical protein [Thermotogota bacterium]